MESDLDFRVLGGIEVVRGGQPVAMGGPKPRLTLALLAAHRGSVVSTDRMCEELWGSNPPADPSAVLQSIFRGCDGSSDPTPRSLLAHRATCCRSRMARSMQVASSCCASGRAPPRTRRRPWRCWNAHSRVGGGRRLRSSPSTTGPGSRRCGSTNCTLSRKRSSSRPASRSVITSLSSGIWMPSLRSIPCGNDCGGNSSSLSIAVTDQRRRFDGRRSFGRSCRRNSGSIPRL